VYVSRRGSRTRILLAAAAATVAAAASLTGISPAAAATPRVPVGDAPDWATPAAKVADIPASQPVTARVFLKLQDAAAAEAGAKAVSDPSSASYHKFLTPAQAAAQFAPTAASVSAVRSWLGDSGFTVTSVPSNNLYVEATGSAIDADKAFGVSLGSYSVAGKQLRAASQVLSAPASVAALISGVTGVNDTLTHSKPAVVPPPDGFRNARPCSAYFGEKTATGLPKYGSLPKKLPYAPCGYVPTQIRSAYGTSAAANAHLDGSGVTVAIVDAFGSPTILSDAQTYASKNDPAHPLSSSQFSQDVATPTPGLEAPDQCDAAGWYGEETLDVEAVHATAPGAKIFYEGGADCNDDSLDVALNKVVSQGLADVVTNSYGDAGEDIDPAEVTAFHEIALLAANEGITLTFSSGDSGDEVANLGGAPSADFSASDPLVTAVGGTSLGIGKTGKITLDTAWETTKSTLTNGVWTPPAPGNYLYGSGGGTSILFAEPWYQRFAVPTALAKKNQTGNQLGRVVPDISMVGDPNTGFLIGETQTFPDGVYYDQYRIGGTSLSSPLFAGLVAVSDQIHGSSQGFLNPTMYLLLDNPFTITDVKHVAGADIRIDYANTVDSSDGLLTSIRTFDDQSLAIRTTPGYDNTTGLGTPHGLPFLLGL
jgi:subtilase family serine protease